MNDDTRDDAAVSTGAGDDQHQVAPLMACSQQDVDRWNAEWLQYLSREWERQFTPYTQIPDRPPLPRDPLDLLDLSLGPGWSLALYCDADALEGKRVMELGCGCGNLGKQLGRYVQSYLGVDFSTMALQIARLVSPPNCSYVHVGDAEGLAPYRGQIDRAVGRYFWIHQNFELAGQNLTFLETFLPPGGRIYADFFWPDEDAEHFVVLKPGDSLSKTYPSAMFQYSSEDVHRLVADRPFRVIRETVSKRMERRYVILEKL